MASRENLKGRVKLFKPGSSQTKRVWWLKSTIKHGLRVTSWSTPLHALFGEVKHTNRTILECEQKLGARAAIAWISGSCSWTRWAICRLESFNSIAASIVTTQSNSSHTRPGRDIPNSKHRSFRGDGYKRSRNIRLLQFINEDTSFDRGHVIDLVIWWTSTIPRPAWEHRSRRQLRIRARENVFLHRSKPCFHPHKPQ